MLRITHLTKSYGGVRAVDDCTFTVSRGQITALIGPNGAGKTTVFACVSGFTASDAGAVSLGDRDLTRATPWERARAGISRTFQQVRLWRHLTVEEHLLLALHDGDDRIAAAFRRDTDVQRAAVRAALERVGLPAETLEQTGADLSYGQSKLLELARAVLWLQTARGISNFKFEISNRCAAPRGILLLDEPVAGVNPILRTQIAEILRGLRTDGETILLIEHDMDFVRALADRVVVMAEGKVLLEGTPGEVLKHPEVLEAYLGVEAGNTDDADGLHR